MHALDIAEDHIGLPDASRGLLWATFHPSGTTGGSIVGEKIAVNSGGFNLELLTERYSPEVGKTWAKRRYCDRIDAVIPHEMAEEFAITLQQETGCALQDREHGPVFQAGQLAAQREAALSSLTA
jgi:hypothetical protein